MTLPIVWVPSPKFNAGHPAPLKALVAHRMVGNLTGTDAAFSNPAGRSASTTFGIGHKSGHLEIHQYVRLGDQAWANGNWDPSGQWDDHYSTANINSKTVAIEHEDNGHLPPGDPRRGIVTEDILEASIDLMASLLRGDLAELRGLGIRFRAGTEADICRELRAIDPGPDTIIDHHYIAGALKPSCWRPWAQDKVGFPKARYLVALTTPPAPKPPVPEDSMGPFNVPEAPTRAYLREDPTRPGHSVWLYTTDQLKPDGKEVSLDPKPFRPLALIGAVGAVSILAYEPAAGDANATSTAMYVATANLEKTEPVPVDCKAQVDAATASLTSRLGIANGRIAKAATDLGATPPAPI